MPKSINKVILVGNLGQDPDVKYTPNGVPVAKFSVATNERFKDKSGEYQEQTDWHNVVAWRRLAEIVGEYLSKGSKVYVEGKLQTSSWKDQQSGDTKYRTEIVARELVLLGSSNGGRAEEEARSDRQGPSASNQRSQQREGFDQSEITDADIPF